MNWVRRYRNNGTIPTHGNAVMTVGLFNQLGEATLKQQHYSHELE